MSENLPTTILIIDDEESLRSLLEIILEGADFRVLVASNADEALETLKSQEEPVRAALLDLNLNQIKGEDFYDEIVAIDPNISVFPMSGCLPEEIEERFANKRIAGVITKPFLPSDLLNVIEQGLSSASN